MKHIGQIDAEAAARLIEELGVDLPEGAFGLLLKHVEWLIETNQVLNLTSVSDPEAAVRLHLVDSLTAVPEVLEAPAGRLVDMGTGGGFPGLELSLACSREALLVDSVRKKSDALAAFLVHENLGTRVSVSASRVEELCATDHSSFAVATARALSSLPSLVELAAPLLTHGGRLVAFKARPDRDELERGRSAAEVCGMREFSVRGLLLPGDGEQRTIVTYEKTGPSKVPLPRRTGLAQRRPLA